MNLYAILNFFYMVTAKLAMNSGVNPIDLMLIRSFLSFLHATVMVKFAGEELWGPKTQEHCKWMVIRSFVGTWGFGAYVYGI
jgi:hypothetical protein